MKTAALLPLIALSSRHVDTFRSSKGQNRSGSNTNPVMPPSRASWPMTMKTPSRDPVCCSFTTGWAWRATPRAAPNNSRSSAMWPLPRHLWQGCPPRHPKEAGGLAGKYKGDRALYRERLKAGSRPAHRQQVGRAPAKWQSSATASAAPARWNWPQRADLKGVVTFHGGLSTPTAADAKNIKCPVLVLHGADDRWSSR